MRIRTIKPEFYHSESVGRLSRDARLLFIGLWTASDDEGRTRGSASYLAGFLFAYDEDARDKIDGWLGELEREDMIRRYDVRGSTYIEIVNWKKHQKIDRPSESRLPANPDDPRVSLAKDREPSMLDLGPTTKDLDHDHGSSLSPNGDVGMTDSASHSKSATPRSAEKPKKPARRDECFEVLAELHGGLAEITDAARGPINKALADIRSVRPDLTPEELRRRIANYKLHFHSAALTASALSKNWGICSKPPDVQPRFQGSSNGCRNGDGRRPVVLRPPPPL